MKTKFAILSLVALLSFTAVAQNSPYAVKTNVGSTSAEVIFAGDPTQPFRLTTLDVKSDLAASIILMTCGGASYALTSAQTNSATNVLVSSTSGLASNQVVVFQTSDGALASATVYSTNSTNVNFSGTISTALASGTPFWIMGNSVTQSVGAATLRQYAEALYAADAGRPVRVTINGTSACAVNNAVGKYGP